MKRQNATRLGLATLTLALVSSPPAMSEQNEAATFPRQRIRMIMGQSPGGAPDILTRILTEHVSQALGQPVVQDYKPSAGGVIALESLAKSPADGHTWLLGTPAMLAVYPYLKKTLPFDPFKDFLPVTIIGQTANVLVAGPALDVKTPADIVRYAKANPDKVSFASAGIGSAAHLAGELFASLTNTHMQHIPYKGAGQALGDVAGGQVDFMITSPAAAKTYMQSGRIKAMATTGSRPDPILPELPLLSETVPGYEITQWWGIVIKAGTPDPIVKKIHSAFVDALKDPKVKALFQAQGVTPQYMTVADYGDFIQKERVRYQDLLKRANVPVEE